ncbi:hypothetical protein ACJX0J_029900 [Zea mays]
MIDTGVKKNHITGVLSDILPGGISHIQYADDTIIMIDGEVSNFFWQGAEKKNSFHMAKWDMYMPEGNFFISKNRGASQLIYIHANMVLLGIRQYMRKQYDKVQTIQEQVFMAKLGNTLEPESIFER